MQTRRLNIMAHPLQASIWHVAVNGISSETVVTKVQRRYLQVRKKYIAVVIHLPHHSCHARSGPVPSSEPGRPQIPSFLTDGSSLQRPLRTHDV